MRSSFFACALSLGALVACGPAAPAPLVATRVAFEGARAQVLSSDGPWMQHELAMARPGDVLIENAFVRFYIAGTDPARASLPHAGRIVDAGLAASPGRPDYDGIEEIYPLVNIAPLVDVSVLVASDGADGDDARVVVEGRLEAIPDAFSLQGAQPRVVPVRVTHVYSLGSDDRALEIRTRVENTSAEPQPVKIGELATFGDDEAESFSVPGGFGLDSEAHVLELVGSAHETRAVSYAMFGDGVPLTLFEQSTVRDQMGSNDTGMWGYHVADTVLEPGEVLEVARYLAVGSDVASVLGEVPTHAAPGRVRGSVTSGGRALAGARVSFFRDPELRDFVTQALSVVGGGFDAALPPGDYFAVATGRGNGELVATPEVVRELAEGHLPSPVTALTVPIDGDARLELELGAAARVRLTVRDTRGAPLPSKITFIAEDERPPPLTIAGERVPYPSQGIRQLVWTATGDAELALEPGVYTVIASHGPSYELDVRSGVVLEPGATGALELVLERVLEHEGWLAMDSHVHGVFSQHGEATGIERVITEAAEGLDVAISTDHDFVSDYGPAAARTGLAGRLLNVSGVELTTRNGHHCIWPLTYDAASARGGAPSQGTLSLEQSYAHYRERGGKVFTVAHGAGYFKKAGYDARTGTVSRPERFTWGFNAMELHNGKGWGGGAELVPIFASLINHGRRIAAVAASDSHSRAFEVGVGRTYVRVGAARDAESVAAGVLGLHTVASTGPFVALDAGGAGPGDLVTPDAAGGVTITLEVRAASWMPIERVMLFENGAPKQSWDASSVPSVALGDGALWFRHELRLEPGADSWYSVEVAGNAELAPVIVWSHPWAYSAPLFIDADRDGTFTALCQRQACE